MFKDRVHERVKAHHYRVESLVEDVFWLWNEKLAPERAERIVKVLPPCLAELWPKGS